MIKSCEDIKTMNEFDSFHAYFVNTTNVGLVETARLIRWDQCRIMEPELFSKIYFRHG